jgi:hypothetical protein
MEYEGNIILNISSENLSHSKIPTLECDLENTKNKTKDFIILENVPTLIMLSIF